MRRWLALAISALLGATPGCVGGNDLPPAHVGAVQVWVLAGQSNMMGTAPPEAVDRVSHPRVFAFDGKRWHRAVDPLPHAPGVGPGLTFARTLVEHDSTAVVGLVQCAKGGTSILEWRRGGNLYETCIARARAASTVGEIAGVLWFQGESDVASPTAAPWWGILGSIWATPTSPGTRAHDDWPERFGALVGNLRVDLGHPDLPVVFAQLGPLPQEDGVRQAWPSFKNRQAAIRLPHVAMIRTDDLAMADEWHFDAPSYREIGRRFAGAALALR